jgi:hypothetical protein
MKYWQKSNTNRTRIQDNNWRKREVKMAETPKYSVSRKQNEIEIRQYSGYIQAANRPFGKRE